MTGDLSLPPASVEERTSQESAERERLRFFTTPLSQRGWPPWLVYLLASLALVYLLNPTLGIFELLPDNLPIVGNLDEGAAFLLLWFGIVELLSGRKGSSPQGGE